MWNWRSVWGRNYSGQREGWGQSLNFFHLVLSHHRQVFGLSCSPALFNHHFNHRPCGFSSLPPSVTQLLLLPQPPEPGPKVVSGPWKFTFISHKVKCCFLMEPHTPSELVKIFHTKIASCWLCESRVFTYLAPNCSLWFSSRLTRYNQSFLDLSKEPSEMIQGLFIYFFFLK